MICGGPVVIVKFFEVVNQVVNPLRIQKSSDDLGWLGIVDRSQVLLHRCIVVALPIKIVSILSEDDILLSFVCAKLLRQVDGVNIQIALVQDLQLLL